MNKYIGILLLILLSSCREDFYTQHIRTYRVINNLSSRFILNIQTDYTEKSFITNGNEINTCVIDKNRCRSSGFLNAYFNEEDLIYEYNFSLYNILDTSSYSLEYYIFDEKIDSIFDEHLYLDFLNEEVSNLRVVDTLTLTIDSTLLPIFKKDYSMLEQFKEYYE
jgi:hypothetical protein